MGAQRNSTALVDRKSKFFAVPAVAKKKKPKPKPPVEAPAPVPTVMYLDGESDLGEEDGGIPVAAPGDYLKLTKEAGTGEKSVTVASYSVGPNNSCAGNNLFPVFVGDLKGTVTGDLKVTFEAVGTPGGKVEVRVWPDLGTTPEAPACNDANVPPAGSVVVDIPTSRGAVEAVIPGLSFPAVSTLTIQLTAVAGTANPPNPTFPPWYARAYYGLDTTKVEFPCLPEAGSASCLP